MSGSVMIEVRDLEFRYQPGSEAVLRDVDLQIREGDFVALLGQNGAGKTTLAKHFNGLLTPVSGDVLVRGSSTRGQRLDQLARTVGYCYQNPDHQIFAATVEREIRFGPHNLGLRGEELDQATERALDLVNLTEQRQAHPFSLGRGQRQLLAVGSILAIEPPVLVVDEPTTGMDHRGATRIMDLLAQWNVAGRTIVVITHDMDVVAQYVPTSVVMSAGEIIAVGDTLEVLSDDAVLRKARLECPPVLQMSQQLAALGIPACGDIERLAAAIAERLERDGAGRV